MFQEKYDLRKMGSIYQGKPSAEQIFGPISTIK